jgi:general secretion pathway protein A
MYTEFFRLKHAPFSIAPDPRYLFLSERHREALAHLLYGVGSGGGFVLLTGEIGTGKTTVCRCFLEQIPANCNVAYIFNPKLTVNELLQAIGDEFGLAASLDASVKVQVDALNRYLLAQHAAGRNNVLIIDEAQNLSVDVLEQLRLLTNLETSQRKLLQIILIGQPELRQMLAQPELAQLAQRVIARYHLDALAPAETAGYVQHRLAVAGLSTVSPFPPSLLRQIHQRTQGIPRRINLLCDRALLGAYAESKPTVERAMLEQAAREVFAPASGAAAGRGWRYVLLGLLAGATMAAAAAWSLGHGWPPKMAAALLPAADSRSRAGQGQVASAVIPASAAAAVANSTLATPVPVAQPPAIDLDSPPASNARDQAAAYRQLAQLWHLTLPAGEPCQAAQVIGLRCYPGSGGFAELRQLDRPALLTLHDASSTAYYALLTAVTDTSALLQIGGVEQRVSLVQLAAHIDGEFVTFWRAPPAYRKQVASGDQGPEVDWLALQLAKLYGTKAPVANQPFDPVLGRQVRQFQLAQGMTVDGVAGPKTFMQLNRAAGLDEPRLRGMAVASTVAGK